MLFSLHRKKAQIMLEKKLKSSFNILIRTSNDAKMLKVLGIGDFVRGNLHSKKVFCSAMTLIHMSTQ